MEVEFTITREDYWAFNKHQMSKQFAGTLLARWWLYVVLFGAVMVLGVVLTVLRGDLGWVAELARSATGKMIGVLLIAVLGLLLLLGVMVLVNRRSVMRLPSDKSDTLGDRRIHITPEGIQSRTALGESFHQWDGVLRIEETDQFVYLFTDNMAAYLVPKRAFKSDEEVDRFVKTCRSHWKKARAIGE